MGCWSGSGEISKSHWPSAYSIGVTPEVSWLVGENPGTRSHLSPSLFIYNPGAVCFASSLLRCLNFTNCVPTISIRVVSWLELRGSSLPVKNCDSSSPRIFRFL
ncbi:hypothetical protein NPIL_434201 [Nephila pilipes]|uniref:Uncharacterized protein n=1 Tax=Nephila pilipes TaxID=299642 RepID=A0A8X6P4R2_NEPPI|nr:hypothetical protein NPIL_434201 [Nephila pilipes]